MPDFPLKAGLPAAQPIKGETDRNISLPFYLRPRQGVTTYAAFLMVSGCDAVKTPALTRFIKTINETPAVVLVN